MGLVNGLPDFVQLSPARKWVEIVDDGTHYRVNRLLDNRDFDLPSQAYDYIRSDLGLEVVFNPADFKRHPSEIGDDSTFYVEPGTGRLLMAYVENGQYADLREDYADFLTKNAAYEQYPNDFYTAYDWLEHHPAFWSGHAYKNGDVLWETNFGLGHDAPGVFKDDEGRVRVLIEAGPYMGDCREQHSIDTRLTAVAATYEAAVVLLASKVAQHYDLTGAER